MDGLISTLSEIRSQYNCFDEAEELYYRALSEAIKILFQHTDGDTISRQAAINDLQGRDPSQIWDTADIEVWVNSLPSAQPEQQTIAGQKSDLIYRETARRIIDSPRSKSQMLTVLKCTPPVQPERKKGKWIEIKNRKGKVIALKCDQCLGLPKRGIRSDFCPNCGVRMGD